ncbi:hypothetical protein HBI56_168010 [Parastagonospora nodorum]|nr:hypothetical protein HBH51_162390 [Parastagonospora nodorum]KAH3988740.1 hypothetical protein HBH52_025700 [Parastagonospora nodorum]KAH4067430.1 hypothetical protein HBH50_140160 [Parastagonospora nodorum]KAH4077739.1 hypothetical protein HBH48_239030 [Parastagonospora nodorum]KAH4107512.1 hypothetical protein HBH46_053650 [Parastagonospora nodorum]
MVSTVDEEIPSRSTITVAAPVCASVTSNTRNARRTTPFHAEISPHDSSRATSIPVRSNSRRLDESIRNCDGSSHSPPTGLRTRLKLFVKSLLNKPEIDIWNKLGTIAIIVNGRDEIRRAAAIRFDPQCDEDIITTAYLRENFGLTFDTTTGEFLADSITGREEYQSIAIQELRWWTSNLLRFQGSTCHVVDSELFDIIIGKKTIDRLGLYKVRRGMIAAFISRQPSINKDTSAADQKKADERREKERKDKDERDRKKKEERLRKRKEG